MLAAIDPDPAPPFFFLLAPAVPGRTRPTVAVALPLRPAGALCGRADCSYDATPSFPGEFGIHLVNTSARPYVGPGGGGGTDNADVEAHFARKLHGAIADGEVGCGGAHGGWVFSD